MLIRWFIALCLLCNSAFAHDVVVERAWVEDPEGRMTHQEIRSAPQNVFEGEYFVRGFSPSAFWIRLRIDPARMPEARPDERLVVRMRPVYLDRVELHDPLHKTAEPVVTGDRISWLNDGYKSLNLNFVISLGEEPRDIWLRLQTTSSTLASISVLRLQDAQAIDWEQSLVDILLLSVLLMCLGWGVLSWLMYRDRLIKYYLLRELVSLMYALATLGFLRVAGAGVLRPELVDGLTNALIVIHALTLMWFQSHLLEVFKPNVWLLRLYRCMPVVLIADLLVLAMGQTLLALQIVTYTISVAIVLDFLTAMSTRAWKTSDPDGPPVVSRLFLMSVYIPLVFSVLINRLIATNMIPPSEGVFYMLWFYPIVGSIVVMAVLHVRAYRLQRHQMEVGIRLQLAEHDLEAERDRRQEQERFVSMLAHELKTPISVAKISLDAMGMTSHESERIARALRNINDVVDRCQVSDAMENNRLHVHAQEFELRDLLYERIDLLLNPERVKVNEGNQIWISSDSHLVGIVISNLLDNALKYSADQSWVRVVLLKQHHQDRPGVCMVVENQVGPAGVPDAHMIFQKYYRAKAAESQSGSGLGLYLCAGLVAMLGGELEHRVVGNNVEFHFWLPDSTSLS